MNDNTADVASIGETAVGHTQQQQQPDKSEIVTAKLAEMSVANETVDEGVASDEQTQQPEVLRVAEVVEADSAVVDKTVPSSETPQQESGNDTVEESTKQPENDVDYQDPILSLPESEQQKVRAFINIIEPIAKAAEPLESISFTPNSQTAIRFLRARDWNENAAKDMYASAVSWSKEYGLRQKCDKWRQKFQNPETQGEKYFVQYWPTKTAGTDREGMPINYVRNGVADYGGLLKACDGGEEAFMCSYFWRLEDTMRTAYEMGKGHIGFVDVYDMAACGVPGWTKRAYFAAGPFKTLAQYLDRCYPERVRKTYILRVPWMFNAVWKLFQPLLPKATRAKIAIYGSGAKDQEKWLTEIKEHIALDQFPEMYGGTGADADLVPTGGLVPKV